MKEFIDNIDLEWIAGIILKISGLFGLLFKGKAWIAKQFQRQPRPLHIPQQVHVSTTAHEFVFDGATAVCDIPPHVLQPPLPTSYMIGPIVTEPVWFDGIVDKS